MRLTMVQVLINSKGLNMNPIQSLYYVSPACFVCLLVPFCKCMYRSWPWGTADPEPLTWCVCVRHVLSPMGLGRISSATLGRTRRSGFARALAKALAKCLTWFSLE